MWNISNQSFGFVLTFSGKPDAAELTAWLEESKLRLSQRLPAIWGIVGDMRELQPLDPGAQAVMSAGQMEYKRHGMSRAAVVLVDPVAIMQFRRLGRGTGVDSIERFINAVNTPNWQSAAKQWVVAGTEPPQ